MPPSRAVVASDLIAQCDANAEMLAATIWTTCAGKPKRIRRQVKAMRALLEARCALESVVPIRCGSQTKRSPDCAAIALDRLERVEAILAGMARL